MSQKSIILARLKRGTLTQLQAIQWYGTMRLASRINELRSDGHNIETEMIKTKGGARVARYRLRRRKG